MTAVALAPFVQLETNGGLPLAGGKVFTYVAGTLTPLATYTDRNAGTPNANPVILDSAGRAHIWLSVNVAYKIIVQDSAGNVIDSVDNYYAGADPAQLTAAGIVPSTGGTYTGLVSFTGGATFDGTPAQDLATLNSLGIASAQNLNLWTNSDFAINTSSGSVADGGQASSRTDALCDTGSVTVSRVDQPTNGVPFAVRLTQPDAAPKRMGISQRVIASESYAYRGSQLVFVPKVRCSASTTIRAALVAWTGTADAAPADVVNNWASTNYTAGNFFIANTSTIAVTATAVTAGTFTDCLVSSASAGGVVVPNGTNNLYLVVWTDLAVAQNVTLDSSVMRAGVGTETPYWVDSDYKRSYGRLLNVQFFSVNGTYTPTPGTTKIVVDVIGAGGAGGGSVATAAGTLSIGSGGGAGGFSRSYLASGFYPSVAVTVGTGGAGVSGGNGNAGGATSFGAFITMPGGSGGTASAAGAIAGVGGGNGSVGTGGNLFNQRGNPGTGAVAAFAATYLQSGAGGASVFGGAGGFTFNFTGGGAAGTNGTNSSASGAGGGGGCSTSGGGTTTGGGGSAGFIIIHEYA